jgi:hypothetical protein
MAAHVYTYIEGEGGGGVSSIEGRYLQTSYAESGLNDKVVGHTKLGAPQKVYCVLSGKQLSYSCWTFYVLIKLPYYVLWTRYIMFVKLYYRNYSGDQGPPILFSRAAFFASCAENEDLHAFQGGSRAPSR